MKHINSISQLRPTPARAALDILGIRAIVGVLTEIAAMFGSFVFAFKGGPLFGTGGDPSHDDGEEHVD